MIYDLHVTLALEYSLAAAEAAWMDESTPLVQYILHLALNSTPNQYIISTTQKDPMV